MIDLAQILQKTKHEEELQKQPNYTGVRASKWGTVVYCNHFKTKQENEACAVGVLELALQSSIRIKFDANDSSLLDDETHIHYFRQT